MIGDEPFLLKTEEETKKYSIFDVVVPIIGKESFLDPSSSSAKVYAQIMFAEGTHLSDFSDHNDS